MEQRGVRTLFLATSHHSQAADVVRPQAVSATIEAAHSRGMRVVTWYQPSLIDPDRDFRRSMAAIRFRTSAGERADSFALDIEARLVRPPSARNTRLLTCRAHPRCRRIRLRPWRDRPFSSAARPLSRIVARLSVRATGQVVRRVHADGLLDLDKHAAGCVRVYPRQHCRHRHKTRGSGIAVHVIGGTARHEQRRDARLPRCRPRLWRARRQPLRLPDHHHGRVARARRPSTGRGRSSRNCSWHDRAGA